MTPALGSTPTVSYSEQTSKETISSMTKQETDIGAMLSTREHRTISTTTVTNQPSSDLVMSVETLQATFSDEDYAKEFIENNKEQMGSSLLLLAVFNHLLSCKIS